MWKLPTWLQIRIPQIRRSEPGANEPATQGTGRLNSPEGSPGSLKDGLNFPLVSNKVLAERVT
jgi:hypothetical protein